MSSFKAHISNFYISLFYLIYFLVRSIYYFLHFCLFTICLKSFIILKLLSFFGISSLTVSLFPDFLVPCPVKHEDVIVFCLFSGQWTKRVLDDQEQHESTLQTVYLNWTKQTNNLFCSVQVPHNLDFKLHQNTQIYTCLHW